MNQRGSMNQRTDELERILNASKVNYSSPQVSQQPTLYEVQRRYAEDLKQLRQQFEESQRQQEKEKQIDRLYDLLQDQRAIALCPSQTFRKLFQRDAIIVHTTNQVTCPCFRLNHGLSPISESSPQSRLLWTRRK